MNLKQISIIALTLAASIARAGEYGEIVDKQNRCEREGRMAAEYFTSKTVFGKTVKEHASSVTRGEIPQAAFTGILMITINAQMPKISTERAAYMDAWATCMDRK